MNELERWRDRGCITLVYSDVAHVEASFGCNVRAAKAAEFSWVSINPEYGGNEEVRLAISEILFPEGPKNQNQLNDVLVVYHAERLGWPLVTTDGNSKTQPGGILGHAAQLLEIGIEVLSPDDALSKVLVSKNAV